MHLHGMENLTFRCFVPTGDILRNQTYAHLEGRILCMLQLLFKTLASSAGIKIN